MPDIAVDERLVRFLLFLPFFFLSLAIHEYAHAFTASKFGDNTAKELGRLTLNPIKHIDLVGSVIMPIMSFASGFLLIGWAKPVPVDRSRLGHPLRDDLYVSAAGPISNFLLAVLFFVVIVVTEAAGIGGILGQASQLFWYGVYFNIFLCLFNLLPIPPLDGSHILFDIFPNKVTAKMLNLGFYGSFILLLFIWSPLWGYFMRVVNLVFDVFAGYGG